MRFPPEINNVGTWRREGLSARVIGTARIYDPLFSKRFR